MKRKKVLEPASHLITERTMAPIGDGGQESVERILPVHRMALVLHRTFESSDRGEPTYYVGSADEVRKLEGVEIGAWIETLTPRHTVRLTGLGTFLPVLMALKERGVRLVHCNWHRTGIEKGLSADKITRAFAALPDDIFREFKPRRDLLTLRKYVAIRAAVMQYRIAAGQKITEEVRSLGLSDDNKPAFIQAEEDRLQQDIKATETPLEKEIAKLARTIPECVLLNKILAVSDKSWMTSAVVMAYVGDIQRFATVSKLWHYSGQHVVDGKAPKRTKGQAVTWNTELRTALWKWADSMLKTKNPVWRPVYDAYLVTEKIKHATTCKCGRDSHAGARARRRVVKDVLAELWRQTHNGSYGKTVLVSSAAAAD